jgi:hypothetical protein
VIEAAIRSAFVGYPKDDDRDGRMYRIAPEEPKVGSCSYWETDAARARGLPPCHSRSDQQADGQHSARTIEAHRRDPAEPVSLAERIGVLGGALERLDRDFAENGFVR